MLTKSKNEIVDSVHWAVKDAIRNHAAIGNAGWAMTENSVMGQLSDLIAVAVETGIRVALDNMYTNEEFERDLDLKS